tara:strand:+ start:843 stop:983 length:141 start_codon:yes stop_codon:yes gene_type:complete
LYRKLGGDLLIYQELSILIISKTQFYLIGVMMGFLKWPFVKAQKDP